MESCNKGDSKHAPEPANGDLRSQLPREIPVGRFKVVAKKAAPRFLPWMPQSYFGGWKRLDDYLSSEFGVE
jgi:hypothetical protein